MEEQEKIAITKEDLIPYIKQEGRKLQEELREAREKLGSRYNERNRIELMYEKFGNPMFESDAKKFADEFYLITHKKSRLPATIRYAVQSVGEAALERCYLEKMSAREAEKKADV